MAACTRTALKVLGGCQRRLVSAGGPTSAVVPQMVARRVPARTFAAVKTARKAKKEEPEKEAAKEKRVIDDTGRHKPFGKTAWHPVDDVYVRRFYPRQAYDASVAIDMLKSFQVLDFTPADQPVYVDLRLDMKLEKKKKVDAFVSTVQLPHPLKKETNKIIVFTENPDQIKVAQESGALAVGGAELVQKILDDEISADFYVAVPEVLPKLLPLKNKLRKKFPKNKRGSVGVNIPKMMALFTSGHEYVVVRDCYVVTQIGTLDMPREQIFDNLQSIVIDVCNHRPASFGHFIERAIISSKTSEGIWFKSEDVLPPPPPEDDS